MMNPAMNLLREARDLRRRKARERSATFLCEGVRVAEELLASSVEVRGAVYTQQLRAGDRGLALLARLTEKQVPLQEVSDGELESAAQTDSPQGVVLLAQVPGWSFADIDSQLLLSEKMGNAGGESRDSGSAGSSTVLLLDAVQDPGNAGTILRSAAAFGANATIALPGTVDLWSGKVVRSAMGTHFKHTAFHASWDDTATWLAEKGYAIWGAESGSPEIDRTESIPERVALAVGNEGGGLTADLRAAVHRSIGVRIRDSVESLNVSVAAGILLHRICLR